MAAQFATNADLGERLGLTLTADEQTRADGLLQKASALIQSVVPQTIELVTDDVYTRRGTTDERFRLPERPVVSVASVTLDGLALVEGTDWYLDGNDIVRIPTSALMASGRVFDESFAFPYGTGFGWEGQQLQVTYTHGYASNAIPGVVSSICLEMVVRVWANPNSVARENIAGVSTVFDNMRFSPSGLLLTDNERDALRRFFGRKATSVQIGGGAG